MCERVGRVSSHAASRWSRSPGCSGFRGVFSVGRIFYDFILFFVLFSSNAHGLIASMRPRYLIYLPTSNGPCERVVPFLISLQIRICMCDSTS